MRFIPFFLVVFLLAVSPTAAQETGSEPGIIPALSPKGDFSELKHTSSGRVDKVIDGLTVLLKDDKIVRLSGIEIPDYALPEPGEYAQGAQEALQHLLPDGTEVMLYQTIDAKEGRVNRMGHELAHLETKNGGIWVQGAMLARGLARVATTERNAEMAQQMYIIEASAREQGLGLWKKDGGWPILTPETAESGIGNFQIVEGTVYGVAAVSNNIYLNFGHDWKKDFTVMISPSVRKQMAHNGIDPLSLAHQRIRARGWIRSYNGPFMELDHPSLLEYPLPETDQTPTLEPNP